MYVVLYHYELLNSYPCSPICTRAFIGKREIDTKGSARSPLEAILARQAVQGRQGPRFAEWSPHPVPRLASRCVFRSKVATRFGLKWPPNSEQNGHLFRSESGRFLATAETGGRHVPK